ncbi:MAG: hypothetical protein AB8C02_18825 [Halioglobus sp.]
MSLSVGYSTASAAQILAEDGVLALISPSAASEPGADPRHFGCGLIGLGDSATHEVWYAQGPIECGVDGEIRWSQSEEMLFAGLWVEEGAFDSQHDAVHVAYKRLLQHIQNRGFPVIVRAWNYMPAINEGEGDNERYRRFCSGRQAAFTECDQERFGYPSACALGSSGGKTVIYLLASREAALHIENPRQKSAYDYPREYGPASPSFARASLANWHSGSALYISGTASIVGHESLHPEDLEQQLLTTFDNVDILLEATAMQAGFSGTPAMSLIKVYVRRPADYADVVYQVEKRFPGVPALYVQAEVCRRELLVEIDGVCEIPASIASDATPVQAARKVASD